MGHVALRGVRLEAGARTLLDGLNLAALPGELIALVGPNGVGKTTLLRVVAGFSAPACGSILLDGAPVGSLGTRERARAVTLLGNDAEPPYGTTVCEVVETGRFSYRPWWDWSPAPGERELSEAALERVGLGGFSERAFETLSSGERQRVWLALALAQEARLVLLDEPTSHLDPRYAAEMLRLIRELAGGSTTVFVVLHDLNEAAAVADRIAVLGQGRLLAFAPPLEALEPDVLERAFGIPFERIATARDVRVLPRTYEARRPTLREEV